VVFSLLRKRSTKGGLELKPLGDLSSIAQFDGTLGSRNLPSVARTREPNEHWRLYFFSLGFPHVASSCRNLLPAREVKS